MTTLVKNSAQVICLIKSIASVFAVCLLSATVQMNDGTRADSKCARLRNPGESVAVLVLLKIIFYFQ
jgi:hypothetical protein